MTGLLAGAVLASGAWAAYWDFSGYLEQNNAYWEVSDYAHNWEIRLSRQYCGTKMQLWSDSGIWRVPIPGGCSTSDYTYIYQFQPYYASECINADGPTMWVNCRVAWL